ncbi:hypothetical protein DXG01_010189 [Tephrocybe rancida]|nr:hypothetical protein DXG01_010189 [Tephrocybe rancida]
MSTPPLKVANDNGLAPKAPASSKFSSHLVITTIALLISAIVLVDPPSLNANTYALCSKDTSGVYTVDAENSQTQCIVVKGSFIADRGSFQHVTERWNTLSLNNLIFRRPSLEVRFTSPGAIIVPGLSDSHAHILEYGAAQLLQLEGTSTIEDTVTRVREYILSNPEIQNDTSKFIIGGGWDHTIWPTTGWPTSAQLDADPVIRGRPVVLQSKDCHALWASSKAVTVSLPIPQEVDGGVIIRDAAGEPTGVFLDNAQDLLKQPELTEADLLHRFHVAVKDAHAQGLTSIHDAGFNPASLAFFKRLQLRIYGMTFFNENEPYWGNLTKPIIGSGKDRLTTRSVKIFADGALRTGGAALYEPYEDNPSTNGFMRLDPEILFNYIPKFLQDGWQVNVHAIGDRANGIVLDAFEASLQGANVTALRPRLEHAQIMTVADMKRLGKLGGILHSSVQSGPKRVKGLYAFRSILDSGARITLGSDFPVESMNPLSGFYAAVTRVSFDGKSPHGPGMTIDPAYASFTEKTLGSLEVGKRADYVVLSQDIMTVPSNEILATKVLTTALDGEAVYEAI